MEHKDCIGCGKHLPDTPEYFAPRLKAGGIWGCTSRCKKCMAARAAELRTIREVKELIKRSIAA